MKKALIVAIAFGVLMVFGGGMAWATHGGPHKDDPTPRCERGRPTTGSGKTCYPPPGHGREGAPGQQVSFVTDAPETSGITVGMATVLTVGALGTLLVIRRMWVFRPGSP